MTRFCKRMLPFFLSILLIFPFSGCASGQKSAYKDTVFLGMDTYITLRLPQGDASDARMEEIAVGCRDIVADLEGKLSCHDPASEVSALNNGVQLLFDADETFLSVWQTAMQTSTLTDGAYDPTLGTLTELWNINGGGPVPPTAAITEALKHTGIEGFHIDGTTVTKDDVQTKIDLGGIAKGYALQEVLRYLNATEIPYGIVSMGGNIGVYGEKTDGTPYKIGIKDPKNTSSVVGYLSVGSGFVSVSGSYERYFVENGKSYHHILDPKTGYPAESGLLSVAVWTQNGAAADALSTALFVMGLEDGMAFYDSGKASFEAIFVTADGEVCLTDGLTASGAFQMTADGYVLAEN